MFVHVRIGYGNLLRLHLDYVGKIEVSFRIVRVTLNVRLRGRNREMNCTVRQFKWVENASLFRPTRCHRNLITLKMH
jgi:hypothetical protein